MNVGQQPKLKVRRTRSSGNSTNIEQDTKADVIASNSSQVSKRRKCSGESLTTKPSAETENEMTNLNVIESSAEQIDTVETNDLKMESESNKMSIEGIEETKTSSESNTEIESSSRRNTNDVSHIISNRQDDPWGPYQIVKRVQMVLDKWGNLAPMRPDVFLFKLLESRGYDPSVIPPRDYRNAPSRRQIDDYDNTLVDAVRLSNLDMLKKLHAEGRTMNACNQYSESILHMAARRSTFEVVLFIVANGGDISIVDDYGRTPLHDACWRTETSFDIITLLLDIKLDLIRTADIRGACPLSYVRESHWLQWCAYFFHQKEKYWHHVTPPDVIDDNTLLKPQCEGVNENDTEAVTTTA